MLLFADELAAQAQATASTSLLISVCTIVIAPTLALIVSKWADGRNSKAKLDAEAMVARAKIETEASLARAKLDLDSKLLVLTSQHTECVKNHADVERKLDECEKQHLISSDERAEMNRKIEKFQEFMAKREARDRAAAENL